MHGLEVFDLVYSWRSDAGVETGVKTEFKIAIAIAMFLP